jgi:hypothetical protein
MTQISISEQGTAALPEDVNRVAKLSRRIRDNFHDAVESIYEVARACAEASHVLTLSEKKSLLEELPFSEATFSKYVQIGADERFADEMVRRLLPPSFSTIYEIRALSDERFREAISTGVINPDLKRAKLQRWTKSGPDHNTRNSCLSIRPGELYCLYSETTLPVDQQSEVKEKMVALADDHGLKAATFTGESLLAEVKKLLGSN